MSKDTGAFNCIYQIMVNFFRQGREVTEEVSFRDGNMNHVNGDLLGVIQDLDRIKDLGFDSIYLSPIFRSNSSHGYDVIDYFSIASHLGTMQDFKLLVDEVQKRSMKLMLDVVLNHVSKDFDLSTIPREYNPKFESPKTREERDWAKHFSFWDNDDSETRRFLTDVCKFWIDRGVSGLRMDYVRGASRDFWRYVYEELKSYDEDVFILGESWNDRGDDLENLKEIDSYSFYEGQRLFDSLLDFPLFYRLTELNREDAAGSIGKLLTLAHEGSGIRTTRFLDNHDLPRIVDMLQGDLNTLRLGLALIYVLSGHVMVLYGTEIPLESVFFGGRLCSRVPMRFEEVTDIARYVQALGSLRKNNHALCAGDFEMVRIEKDLLVFRKTLGDESFIITLNTSYAREFESPYDGRVIFRSNGSDSSSTVNPRVLLVQKEY